MGEQVRNPAQTDEQQDAGSAAVQKKCFGAKLGGVEGEGESEHASRSERETKRGNERQREIERQRDTER